MTFSSTFEQTYGEKAPALLTALAAWQKKEKAFIGVDLELRVQGPEEQRRAWSLDAEAAARLLPFCHDGMDSTYSRARSSSSRSSARASSRTTTSAR